MNILDYKSRIKEFSRYNRVFNKVVKLATRLYALGGVKITKSCKQSKIGS